MDLMSLTAVELGKKIQAKEVTVEEAVKAAIASIKAKEEKINSFVTIDEEGALKKAAEVQAKIDAGELKGALAGVPVAIKDNMCTKGLLTTCSSKILYNFIPTYTAEAVKRLEDAGCVIVGKTNMDEFAMGSTTETSAYGVTRNPWDLEHVPGGSSGGSHSGGSTSYAITVADAENGSATASRKSASKGTTITVTATPEDIEIPKERSRIRPISRRRTGERECNR